MEIVISLPSTIEGEYEIDAEKGVLRIRPKFFKGTAQQTLLYMLAKSAAGAEHKATVVVRAKDGQFSVTNKSDPVYVEPEFDRLKPDGSKASKDKTLPAADRAGGPGGPVAAGAAKPGHDPAS